ncbi:type II secretion system F family protein [Microbacteriaceae bacterium VKM Ac-2855]|nr:type II secretion system F family protein [Microbacteriaceae bacterium VKM Ac-2855]
MSRADADPEIEVVAAVAQRLAVLLSSGVAPASALSDLAELRPVAPRGRAASLAARRRRMLRSVAVAAARGEDVPRAIVSGAREVTRGRDADAARAWAALAAAWRVASETGAPVAAGLHGLAEAMRELGQARRDVEVALAGPRSAGNVVSLLPVVALLFGALLGFDSFGILFGTVPGLICLVLGSGLAITARLWTRALVRRATPVDPAPGLALELLAVALGGGVSVARARGCVDESLDACGLPTADADGADEILALSSRAGVPAARLLVSEAALARRRARSAGQRAAASLSVTLMLPLGVCVLPAFMLLGVAPMVIAVLSSTLGATGGVVLG